MAKLAIRLDPGRDVMGRDDQPADRRIVNQVDDGQLEGDHLRAALSEQVHLDDLGLRGGGAAKCLRNGQAQFGPVLGGHDVRE